MEIQNKYRDYIRVYADSSRDGESMVCDTAFLSDTVYSMKCFDCVVK